ncbi:PucR family transcriptional regulator ligand-binding domain-containing protein [Nonomuraea sp. NPDC049695]|uniref:PucR family transcriptional regulator n=1 Tax=Nonomuraea sp. NPDC049695 TaxID=3154734 RepID=UPI00342C0CCA
MPPPLHTVIRRMGLRPVAGIPGGVGRLDAVVRWVAVSELADPTPYLEGGELLLTTGMRMEGDQSQYVARLVARGVAGLGFGVGVSHEEVPPALVAAADEAGLPLLEVPRETPFIAVGKAVSELLAAEQYEEITRAFAAQGRLTRAALRPEGMHAVIDRLAKEVGGWAALFDESGEVRHASRGAHTDAVVAELTRLRTGRPPAGHGDRRGPGHVGDADHGDTAHVRDGAAHEDGRIAQDATPEGVGIARTTRDTTHARRGAAGATGGGTRAGGHSAPEPGGAERAGGGAERAGGRAGLAGGVAERAGGGAGRAGWGAGRAGPLPASLALSGPGEHIVVQPLGGGARPRGFFAVGAQEPFSPVTHTVINAAGSLLTLAMEQGRTQLDAVRRARSAVLQLLLAGEKERARAVLRPLGGRLPEEPLAVLAADADALEALESHAFAALLDDDAPGPLAVALADSTMADSTMADSMMRDRAALEPDAPVGVSLPCGYAPEALHGALDQARRALEAARGGGPALRAGAGQVVRFGELAGQGLLGLLDQTAVQAFAAALLAPLTAYGSKPDLVGSLRAYLDSNGHWDAAAQRLGVHRHTLRYRMKRVTELLGRDLDDPGVRAELWLALEATRR